MLIVACACGRVDVRGGLRGVRVYMYCVPVVQCADRMQSDVPGTPAHDKLADGSSQNSFSVRKRVSAWLAPRIVWPRHSQPRWCRSLLAESPSPHNPPILPFSLEYEQPLTVRERASFSGLGEFPPRNS